MPAFPRSAFTEQGRRSAETEIGGPAGCDSVNANTVGKPGSFASPPCGGFALATTDAAQASMCPKLLISLSSQIANLQANRLRCTTAFCFTDMCRVPGTAKLLKDK